MTPVLKWLLSVSVQDKQQASLDRPWESVRGIPQSPPAWVRKDLEPLAASPLELHSVEWEKTSTTIPMVGQDIIDLQTEVWGERRGARKATWFHLGRPFGLGTVSCRKPREEESWSQNQCLQPLARAGRKGEEERCTVGGGDGIFNVASLCGLLVSECSEGLRVSGAVGGFHGPGLAVVPLALHQEFHEPASTWARKMRSTCLCVFFFPSLNFGEKNKLNNTTRCVSSLLLGRNGRNSRLLFFQPSYLPK